MRPLRPPPLWAGENNPGAEGDPNSRTQAEMLVPPMQQVSHSPIPEQNIDVHSSSNEADDLGAVQTH